MATSPVPLDAAPADAIQPVEAAAPAKPAGNFDVLRQRNFAWFLTGTTLSNSGQWIQQVTLSWLVYELTGSGAMLGTLNLVRSIATLGLSPIAGAAIDRFPRRKLMIGVNTWLFFLSLIFGVMIAINPTLIWPLFAFSFLGGIAQAVDMPLRQTIIFSLVPRSLAPSAVALVQTGWAVMRSLGPAIGGFLILWVGPEGNFFVQAGAYALVALTILKLTFPSERAQLSGKATRGNLMEGLRYVIKEPTTRAFLLMGWVLPLFIIPNYSALPPIYAKDVFGGGPDTLGALLSAVGIGGIAGGFVSTMLSRFERRGLIQLGSLLLLSLSLIGVGLTSVFWVSLVCLAVSGFFEMIYLTSNQTLLQLSIPDALRGRVTGIVSLNMGLMPIGALIAGVGADFFGPQVMTLVLSSIAGLIAVAVYFFSPIIREYRLSAAMGAGD
ncbi:MAG: MFS transporter [Caldilineaceae bacterium]|nr:MFS transporter [Caldilineaceae bacterium]